jgi:hypothetical protein
MRAASPSTRGDSGARQRATGRIYRTAVKLAIVAQSPGILTCLIVLGLLLSGSACGGEGTDEMAFHADYETGNVSQWTWGLQCANTSSAALLFTRGTITVQSEIVANGSYAARIDLPAASEPTACEGVRRRALGTGHGSPSREEWYALSVRFPTNLQTNSWGMTFGQLNYQTIWGSPLHLFVYGPNDASTEPFHVRLVAQGGLCRPVTDPNPGCQWSNGLGSGRNPMKIIPNSRFTLGVWHDLLVHVVWTTVGAEALYEGFHRRSGGTWLQTVSFRPGQPSVQWTSTRDAVATDTTIDKFGAYRGANSQPVSIWHDNICVAATRAAAESCF